jgi:hypothetical protein
MVSTGDAHTETAVNTSATPFEIPYRALFCILSS